MKMRDSMHTAWIRVKVRGNYSSSKSRPPEKARDASRSTLMQRQTILPHLLIYPPARNGIKLTHFGKRRYGLVVVVLQFIGVQ